MKNQIQKTGLSIAIVFIFNILNSQQTINLMPIPLQVEVKEGKYKINSDFSLNLTEIQSDRLYQYANNFLRRLDGRTGLFLKQGLISKQQPNAVENPSVWLIAKENAKLSLGVDESYKLIITTEKILLESATDIGSMRGLETLLQLMSIDTGGYYFPCIEINDKPRYAWRGLMLDVSRHFMTVDVIKANINAMAAVKLNVLHWHLTDDHGWRIESKAFPLLQEKGSDGLYYTQEQIKEIVKYAEDRGIRVIPEIDIPGHASALLAAYPEFGSKSMKYEIQRTSGIFDPVLNPVSKNTYKFLDKLFKEITLLFPDTYFHIGGDENNGVHWMSNTEIISFFKENDEVRSYFASRKQEIALDSTAKLTKHDTIMAIQTYFNNKIVTILSNYGKKIIGWDEIYQKGLNKQAIIHSWRGKSSMYKAAIDGYKTILSNGYYIDLLKPASNHYLNDPLPLPENKTDEEKKYELTSEQQELILGGEATMWSEYVTNLTADSRIWPRTAAIAERLWSPAIVNNVDDMYRRLDIISLRLEELGIQHIKSRDQIIRNLSNGYGSKALEILLNVSEPYKGYRRNKNNFYKTYSPYVLFIDATSADPVDARNFNRLVNEYSKKQTKETKAQLKDYLTTWKNNHSTFLELSKKSPVLSNMVKLSENLSKVATIGLEALDLPKTAKKDWVQKSTEIIKTIKDQTEIKRNSGSYEDGRCELSILDSLLILIELNNKILVSTKK